MDENKVQELLDQAGVEYNQGRYAEAIGHWQEVLTLDPENQKAREGIRMAKLLVVNWESSQAGEGGGELTLEPGGDDPETQQKIEFGIKRVRELMASGRLQEASEGCQLLAELAPGMPSVHQLQEEITHVFEAQPFVKEHLSRARKLVAAGKVAEAVEEARKVLSVDPSNQEAREMIAHAEGGTEGAQVPPAQSAFAVEKEGEPAPPSPFAGDSSADALMAHVDLDDAGAPADLPAEGGGGEAAPLEMGFEQAPGPGAGNEVVGLIQEGQALFAEKKYEEAIETWSRVFAIDQANAEASELIDQARARMADLAGQAEKVLYRAQDLMEAGDLDGARKAYEEVLAIQPDHMEARDRLLQIDQKTGTDAAPMAEPELADMPEPAVAPPPASQGEADLTDAPSVGLVREPDAPGPPPAAPPGEPEPSRPPSMSAGVMKKKPVVPVPPPRRGKTMVVAGAMAVVVLGAAAVGWFMLFGPERDPVADPGETPSGSESLPVQPLQDEGAGPGEPADPVAGAATDPSPQPPRPPDPAAIRRQVRSLMREGRSLLGNQRYADAHAKFEEVLRLDGANFDAQELKDRAAVGMAEEARFNRDLDAAKQAFSDQDWGPSLYKLYRLRQEREDMAILKRYIKNANYNWGVQSMEGFRIADAIEHFNDALEMAPADRTIKQHLDVATRYERRRRDSAYEAYVSKLRLRAIDAR
jgi:tetratricopeptide (TPR) repeat protein